MVSHQGVCSMRYLIFMIGLSNKVDHEHSRADEPGAGSDHGLQHENVLQGLLKDPVDDVGFAFHPIPKHQDHWR